MCFCLFYPEFMELHCVFAYFIVFVFYLRPHSWTKQLTCPTTSFQKMEFLEFLEFCCGNWTGISFQRMGFLELMELQCVLLILPGIHGITLCFCLFYRFCPLSEASLVDTHSELQCYNHKNHRNSINSKNSIP